MSNPSAALSPGDLVGHYKILGLAGAGGMGVVYRALDLKLERTVALKVLPEHLLSSPEDRTRFLREARTASSLDHPNIGVIYGMEEFDGRSLIVMAYYEGETVARKLLRGPLPLPDAVNIAIHMTEGLAAAHAGAIVHRDIKPSNVIVTQRGVTKVVDFGLAKLASSTGSTQSLSQAGTVGYMSPEQAAGQAVDQRSDIWAIGIVLAEMVTGKNPFQRDSLAATVVAILSEPPRPMDELPLDLLRVIYRALSKEPATRYQSCRELLADLQEIRSHLEPKPASSSGSRQTSGVHAARGKPSTLTAKELRKQIEHASRPIWAGGVAPTPVWQKWLAGVGVLAILAAALSFLPPVRERVSDWFSARQDHIAVLPFENVGNDPANDAVSAGLMDSLSSRLSNLENGKQSLWVVPASEVRRLKISSPSAALNQLGATIAVEGGLQRDGQTIRMTVNLVDTKKMRQIGSVTLEDRAGDFSTLEDEAVTRVAKLMHIEMTPEMLRATGGGAVSGRAYELYLKALGLTQRYDKAGNLDLAIEALENAVKADPRFALGYAQLGEVYRLKYQLDKNTKWIEEALANCNKAAELDNRLPAVYVTLGNLHMAVGKYDLALQEFQRALQLDPHNADAEIGLAGSFKSAGRIADAEGAYRKAISLRPDFWSGYNSLANFLDDHQRYDEAIAEYKKAIQLTPDNAALYLNLGAAYADKGDANSFSEAERALQKSLAIEPSYPAYANLGYLYIQEQRYREAAEMVEKALQLDDKNYVVWGNLAIAHEGLGERDKAARAWDRELALLEKEAVTNPRDAVVHANMGLLYAKKKMREQAISHIESAIVLSPDDANVLENVGEAYEDLGDRKQALQYIEKSLQKGYSLANLKSAPDLRSLLADPAFRPNGK